MRAAARQDEPTNHGGYWVRSDYQAEAIDVPDFTISERTAPTDEVELDALATEEVERQPLVALAPSLPEAPRPTADELPAIDSGAIPRPSRAARLAAPAPSPAEDASTGLFESMDWDEADPYTTGSFPSIPFDELDLEPEPEPEPEDRRPSLAVVQSAHHTAEDAEWEDHRATPLPVPPRPHRHQGTWPPPRPAERAQRPWGADGEQETFVNGLYGGLSAEAQAHVAAWDAWDDWHGEDDLDIEVEPEPRSTFRYWLAVLFNASAFVLGFAATFLSGAITLLTSALVLFAITL